MGMYCNQGEQTGRGIACTISGVCGKFRFFDLDMGEIGGFPA